MRAVETLVHVLSVRADAADRVRVQATVRLGSLGAGDRLWLEGTDGRRRGLCVAAIESKRRFSTIALTGAEGDVRRLTRGVYLYGDDD